jgi:hypothetical protein
MGTLVFHPWPVRRDDVDHPDELRIDLDPQPGTSFSDAVRVAGVARELLEELGIVGYPKTSGNRGVHIYVRIKPEWEFTDLRHAAIGFGRELARRDERRDGGLVEGGARRADLRGLQPEQPRPHDRVGVLPAPAARRPVSTPMTWDELAGVTDPADFNLFTVPDRVKDGDPWAAIDDTAYSLEPLLKLWEELPGGELNFPPDYPKMPASRRACSRPRRSRPTGTPRAGGSSREPR